MFLNRYMNGFLNLKKSLNISTCNMSISKYLFDSTTTTSTPTEEPVKTEKTEGEKKLADMLKKRFIKSKQIEVVDISGGCGSMYAIYVETSEFKNMRTVRQHQLVTEVLKKEIKDNMHGVRIQTAVAPDDA